MRTVELVPGIRSSALGCGCAPVLGAVGAATARRALTAALDLGINHFDIARSYGYGEAEAFLGRFLAGRSDEVVIASKFGIRATWRARLLRPLKPVVRMLRGMRAGQGPPATGPAPAPPAPRARDPFHERVPLTPLVMRRSLEASLRALRRDHLDIFFLHEPPERPALCDDLCALAEKLKDAGRIRAWGLAFPWSCHDALADDLGRFDLLQFDLSPAAAHYGDAVAERGCAANVLFSPLRSRGSLTPTEALSKLWADFPRSVVLCAMFDPTHIRANAAVAGRATNL